MVDVSAENCENPEIAEQVKEISESVKQTNNKLQVTNSKIENIGNELEIVKKLLISVLHIIQPGM